MPQFFAFAQESSSFTESKTGITFQVSEHASGMKFGIAIPKTPGKDFIGFFVSILLNYTADRE
jgi:hypothetical protein